MLDEGQPRDVDPGRALTRRRLFRLSAAAGLTVSAGGLLAACGEDDGGEPSAAPAGGGTPQGGYEGRLAAIAGADYAVALGITPVLVGTFEGEVPPQLDSLLSGVETVDSLAPNIESVVAVAPDDIIGDEYIEKLEQLRSVAPTTLLAYADTGDAQGAKRELDQVAAALSLQAQAEERFAEHRRKLEAARAQLEGVTDTVAFLRIRKKELRLITPEFGYVGPFLYGDLGLAPASFVEGLEDKNGVGYAIISQEVVPQIDADRLLYLADDDETERELTSNRLWQQVPAVAARKLNRVDALVWQTTGILANEAKMADTLQAFGV